MKHKADEFERALQRSARGEPVSADQARLVEASERLKSLSATPPPPRALVPGRQRFLAAAARLRKENAAPRQRPMLVLRLASIAAVILLLFGAVLGAGRVSAASLPGDGLYAVKRAAEAARLALTRGPEKRSALLEAMAEERMGEILALLEQGRTVDDPVASEAMRELRQALEAAARLEDTAAPLALQKLAQVLRQREEAIRMAAGDPPGPAVQAFLREMARVREEAHLGQGDPAGLRQRLRQGTPPSPADLPRATRTPSPSTTVTPWEPSSAAPGSSATPHRTGMPLASPGPGVTSPQPPAGSATPHSTGEPRATGTPPASITSQPTGGPPASQTPGPTTTPQPPHSTPTPGQGGTAAPTTQPGGTPVQTPGGGGGGRP